MTAHDRLQRQLDCEVEVVREQRLDGLDDVSAVGLERVRRVVVAMAEEGPDEPVGEAVEDELRPRIIDHPRAANESRAERAVIPLLEQAVVRHEVGRIVGAVRHHHGHRAPLEEGEPRADGEPEAAGVAVRVAAHAGIRRRRGRHDR